MKRHLAVLALLHHRHTSDRVFFSIFDPAELSLHGKTLFNDKLSAYSVFFLISWTFGALNTSIVLLLEKTPELNGFTAPPVVIPEDDASQP